MTAIAFHAPNSFQDLSLRKYPVRTGSKKDKRTLLMTDKAHVFPIPQHSALILHYFHTLKGQYRRKGAYHCQKHRRGSRLPGRIFPHGRKLEQRQPVLLPFKRPCRCRGTPVYPECHADHDRTFQQPHQPQDI